MHHQKKNKLTLQLLEEKIWKVEDKVDVLIEHLADHEAELINLKQALHALSTKPKKRTHE